MAKIKNTMSGLGFTTIFSLKGGVGKSSISAAIILALSDEDEKIPVITNDAISPLEDILGKKRALVMKPNQPFPEFPKDEDVLIDLGGFVDERTIAVLKQSKQIVIPTVCTFLGLHGLFSTIKEVEPYNKEITIVLNQVDKKEVDGAIQVIREKKHDYPIFKIKFSKAFENLHNQRKSIGQMMEDEPLRKRSYKEVNAQLIELIQHLKGV